MPGLTHRAPLLVACAATTALLAATLAPTAHAAPTRADPSEQTCDPAEDSHVTDARTARLHRVDDQRNYSLRQLRRIDAGLDQRLEREQRTSGPARFGLTFRIPIHAHVIDGRRADGPSKKRVRRQIEILNRAYSGGQSARNSNTRFQFYLRSFDRTRNQSWYTAAMFDPADRRLRRALHRGGAESLNLYFSAPRSRTAGSAILGWSSVPWRSKRLPRLDGVTVNQASMPGGRIRGYNRGDTTVHEVGHWLGLFHTFEGGCSNGNDRVRDTPAEAQPSMQCPRGRDTCAAPGDDPIHNFMNYSYDPCMNMFTRGQIGRMTDNWLAYRTP